jgi:phosphohistidine swiveling domain-containing protein
MKKKSVLRVTLFAILLGAVATVPAMAGSAVIGSVAGSSNATLGGQTLLPNTTIFSGDSLQVHDGVAVISVNNNNRVIVGRDTVASFLRDGNQVTVLLSQGNVSMLHPSEGAAVRVKVGSVSIAPAPGFKTLGEVAMLNGSIVVTAKDGALKVEDHGATKDVQQGQTMVLTPRTANHAGAASGGWGGGDTGWHVAILGAAGVAAVFSILAWNDAKDANTNSQSALNSSNAAASAAAAAASAANAAASAASAAALAAQCTQDLAETGSYTSPVNLGAAACGAGD